MTAVIDSPRAFKDWLTDLDTPEKALAAIADKGDDGFFAKVQSYIEGEVMAKEELQQQVLEQAEAVVAAALQDAKAAKRLNLSPLDVSPRRVGAGHNPKAVGAGLDGVFGDVGEFVQAMWHGAEKYGHARALADQRGKVLAYVEKVPSEGGFLVPEEYRAELLRMSLETAVVRPRARVVPMNSLKLSFPAVDETSHVSSMFGGIIVYRTAEAEALTASNAAFRKVTLEVTKQTALANLSNEVIRDTAGAITTYVQEMVPEAISFAEDDDFLNGTGVGEPLGALVTSNPGTIEQAARSGQGAGTIVWENIVDMYARMLPSSLNRAVWVVAPAAFPALATMGLVVGTGGAPVGIAAGGNTSPGMTLLGRPVIISEKTPGTIGARGDINFVDFGYYLIGDNQRMEFASSEHALFSNLTNGMSMDHRFSATEVVETARLDTKAMQVLYSDTNGVHVMDAQTYEQFTFDPEVVGDDAAWMVPEMTFDAVWLEGKPISFTLPSSMELEVVETNPVMKTATKTASSKPAKLSNGVTIQVPEFVETGERVRVNPRERSYIERVK